MRFQYLPYIKLIRSVEEMHCPDGQIRGRTRHGGSQRTTLLSDNLYFGPRPIFLYSNSRFGIVVPDNNGIIYLLLLGAVYYYKKFLYQAYFSELRRKRML